MSPVLMLKQAPCQGQRTLPLDKTPAGKHGRAELVLPCSSLPSLPAARPDPAAVTWPGQGWQRPGLPPAVPVMVDSSASSQCECRC